MRRGDMYQDDPYSGQFSGGQMYEGGRSSYGGQYDMDHDGGGYNAANLQATMMQMISSMQQAANSMPMGRGGSGLIPDPQRADTYDRPPLRPNSSRPADMDSGCKIYITGIQPQMTKDQLGSCFAACGIIKKSFVMSDKGFGFITFESPEAAAQAVKMSGRNFGGSVLNVSIARPKGQKRERSRSPSGRGPPRTRPFPPADGILDARPDRQSWDGGRSWGGDMPPSYGELYDRNAADWPGNNVAPFRGPPSFPERQPRPMPMPGGAPGGGWQRDRVALPQVDNRTINRELVRFYRLRELQRFVAEHRLSFNTVNTGTAFYQVGILAKKTKGKKNDEPLDTAVVDMLSARALMLAEEMDPHSLTNVFWGLANMGVAPKPQLTSALCKRAAVTWSNFKPQNIAMLLWSFSKLETQPPAEVLGFLLKRAVKVCPEFTPSDVANYLYGLAKLNIKADEQLTQALEKRVVEIAPQLKPQDLSNVLWSYATMGLEPSPGMGEVISKRMKSMTGESNQFAIVTFLWACAKLKTTVAPEISSALIQKMVQVEGDMDLQSLSTFLWSLAKLGCGEDIAALEQKALAELAKKSDSEIGQPTLLANLLWSFGKMGRSLPSEVTDRINRRALALKADFKPSDIASFLWGCAKLGITAEPEALKEFLDQISTKIAYLKSEDVSSIMWTFATMGLDSQAELTSKLVKHAVTLVESFGPEEIVWFLWSLAALGQSSPEVPLFMQTASTLWEKMGPDQKGVLHQVFLSCSHDERFKACCTAQTHEVVSTHGADCRSSFVDTAATEKEDLLAAIERFVSETGQTIIKSAVDETSGYSILAVIQDGSASKGCAVLFEGRRSYIQLSSGVRLFGGASQLRKRHLQSIGYRVVSVPYWEWDECAILGSAAQQGYLSNLLRSRPK